ncbi:UNVERIFIED_CONTAM: hypothetical protein FKN15_052613 [Acipenser sinensis]
MLCHVLPHSAQHTASRTERSRAQFTPVEHALNEKDRERQRERGNHKQHFRALLYVLYFPVTE